MSEQALLEPQDQGSEESASDLATTKAHLSQIDSPSSCAQFLAGIPDDETTFAIRFHVPRLRFAEAVAEIRASMDDVDRAKLFAVVEMTIILTMAADRRAHSRAQTDVDFIEGLEQRAFPIARDHAGAITRVYRAYGQAAGENCAALDALIEAGVFTEPIIGSTSVLLRAKLPADGAHTAQSVIARLTMIPLLDEEAAALARATARSSESTGLWSHPSVPLPREVAHGKAWRVTEDGAGQTLDAVLPALATEDSDRSVLAVMLHKLPVAESARLLWNGAMSRLKLLVKEDDRLHIANLRRLAPLLFEALAELDDAGVSHLNLEPSTILVRLNANQEPSDIRFINPGPTSQHLDQFDPDTAPFRQLYEWSYGPGGISVPREAARNVDLYALGKLLILIGGGDPSQSGVPSAAYVRTPGVARFIEDLIDPEPSRRGQLQGEVFCGFRVLGRRFTDELEAAVASSGNGAAPHDAHWIRGGMHLLLPSARTPTRQRAIFVVRLKQWLASSPDNIERSRAIRVDERAGALMALYLATCSFLCAAFFWAFFGVMAIQVSRWLGLDTAPQALELLQKHANDWHLGSTPDRLAYVYNHALSPPSGEEMLAVVVSTTFAIVNVRMYQNLYAGISPLAGFRSMRAETRVHAICAELMIRGLGLGWVVLVAAPHFGRPETWPAWVMVGMVVTVALNAIVWSFADRSVHRALALRNPPEVSVSGVSGLAKFKRWTPSMIVLSMVVGIIAAALVTGVLKERWPYAVMLALLNLGVFYVVKCSLDAAEIRQALTRSFVLSERAAVASDPRRRSARWAVPETPRHHLAAADDFLTTTVPGKGPPPGTSRDQLLSRTSSPDAQ